MRIWMALLLLLVLGCGRREFDEDKWQEDIAGQEIKELYVDNYREGVYYNPWLESKKSFKTFLKWRFSRREDFSIGDKEYLPEVLSVDIEELRERERYILWIGHMTYLIRDGHTYYLFDPIFSDRALIPKRYLDAPLDLEEVVDIVGEDRLIVLLSHNHYDHLDKKTIEGLPSGTEILLPSGDEELVKEWGDFEITPMRWWDVLENITFVPAQHWSNRADKGRNTSLWGSYILELGDKTILLGCDSGYFMGFKEIGRRWSIDYALISVGAYEPRWFMHESHLNVEESIQVIDDLGAPVMIPGHWGIFKLGDEPPGYPKYQYEKIGDPRVKIMDIGEVIYY